MTKTNPEEDTRPIIVLVSSNREFAALMGLKIEKRGFRVIVEIGLEQGLRRFDEEMISSLVVDMDLMNDETVHKLRLFRDLHSTMPIVFLGSGDGHVGFHELKGPFAVVHKTDALGIFLDKLLDILRFFSNRAPDRHFRPAAPASPTQFALLDQRLAGIFRSVHEVDGDKGEDFIFERILKELSNISGARGGSLFSFEKATLMLKCALDPGHVPETINLPLKPKSPFEQAFSQAQPLLIKDIRGARGLAHSGWQGYNDGSLMVIPLTDAEMNIVSLISLHNKVEPPFDERDLELCRLFASISSQLLFSPQDHGKTVQEHYRELAARSAIGLVLFDDTGQVLEVNDAFCQMVGKPLAEWGHSDYWQVTYEKYRAPEQVLLQELSALNRPSVFQKMLVRLDGSLIKVRLRYSLFKDQDRHLYLASVEQI